MIKLRIARPEDGAALAEIYAYYVSNTAVSFECEPPTAAEFSGRIEQKLATHPYLVAEEDGEVLGYAYASAFRERAAYDWDTELSVYVRRDARGKGIGKKLYTALIGLLREQNFVNLYAWITTPNPTSESFHAEMGFAKLGEVEKVGFKHGAWYGVTWYGIRLCEGEPRAVVSFPELDAERVKSIIEK